MKIYIHNLYTEILILKNLNKTFTAMAYTLNKHYQILV